MVVVGKPKSGKTRLAWELLRDREEALVVIPDTGSPRPPDVFEGAGLVGNDIVLFFDDLQGVAQTMEPLKWRDRLAEVSKQSCLLICTVRDGSDWEKVDAKQSRLLDELGADSCVFVSRVGGPEEERGEDVSPEQARQLGEAIGLSDEELRQRFDGTFGSVVLDVADMSRRYRALSNELRGEVSMSRLLDSAKLLYKAWQPSFHAPTLRAVAEEIRGHGRMSSETWDALVRRTQEEGFASFDDAKNLLTYRPYLKECVSYTPSLEEIVDLWPILLDQRDSNGLFYFGLFWAMTGAPFKTLDCFEEVCRLDPDDTVLYNLGNARYDVGKHKWFEGQYVEARGLYKQAIDAYDAALEIRRDYAEAYYNKGNALFELEEYGKAIKAYDAADAAVWTRPDRAYARYNKGNILMFKLEEYEKAIDAYEAALRISPDYVDAHYNKGIALVKLEKKQEAIGHLCRAWPHRERLPDQGASLVEIFAFLGMNPEDCQ